jgi:hypothetical protein
MHETRTLHSGRKHHVPVKVKPEENIMFGVNIMFY